MVGPTRTPEGPTMSGDERRLADSRGRFLVQSRGEEPGQVDAWRECRLLLSNKRLILAGSDRKRTFALREVPSIRHVDGNGPRIAGESTYTRIELDDHDVLLQSVDHAAFQDALDTARVDGVVVQVRSPRLDDATGADPDWTRARLGVDGDGALEFRSADGAALHLPAGVVRDVEVGTATIDGTTVDVLEIEHGEPEATSRTVVAAAPPHRSHLEALLRRRDAGEASSADLEAVEARALTALYSGISPFDVPAFIDADVEAVEAAYDSLVDRGVLDEVRVRREVTLTPRGRNLASETIGDG